MQDIEFTAAMQRAVASRGADYRYPNPTDAPEGYYAGISATCPTYSTPTGEATCLIAVAMVEAGMDVPRHEAIEGADALLIQKGVVSHSVALAARCAQIHQDYRNSWGEAYEVYEAALELQARGDRHYSVFTGLDLYIRAAEAVTGMRPNIGRDSSYGVIDLHAQVQKINETKSKLAEAFAGLGKAAEGVAAAMPTIPSYFDGATKVEVSLPEVKPVAKGGWIAPSEVINLSDIYSPDMYGGKVTMNTMPTHTWTGSVLKKDHALTA